MTKTRDPLLLTLLTPFDSSEPSVVLETEVSKANADGQAELQNRVMALGSVETLAAMRPIDWQRRLVRALFAGVLIGAMVSGLALLALM